MHLYIIGKFYASQQAFIMYLSSSSDKIRDFIEYDLELDDGRLFRVRDGDSKLMQFIKGKLGI